MKEAREFYKSIWKDPEIKLIVFIIVASVARAIIQSISL